MSSGPQWSLRDSRWTKGGRVKQGEAFPRSLTSSSSSRREKVSPHAGWDAKNNIRFKEKNGMKTIFVKPQSVEKKWYLIDAEGKNLGRVAVVAARILRGKNKPEYVPHQDMGDYVIIINAEKATVTGNKLVDKKYYRHSMFPGGLTVETYGDVIQRKPTFPMEHAIKGMLPHGKLGRALFRNLKVYAGSEHPHAAQQPIAVEL